ncbi:MAG: glycosyltransferase family 9 protein [Simkaniaceae bacterium]|nr:glycosyltransferase family 9 protein [Simkaniaceae bacterium]
MKKAALLCASGLGDGLLMMIGAYHLKLAGYLPTIFHDAAKDLSLLFESDTFISHVPIEDLESILNQYDRVIVENDNSARAWHLFSLQNKGKLKQMTFFFPTHSKNMKKGDFLFDPKFPVATNLSLACQKILQTPETKENGLTLPQDKLFKKYPKRVIIHPTSNDPKRNWKQEQFLSLARKLEKKGFSVVFCVGPSERKYWEKIEEISLPKFSSLKEVKDFIYESGFLIGNDSGLGHLASNLRIPTLTISGNPKRVRLWRPNWALGKVATLPFPLPNFKGINLGIRENFWQNFVSVSRVYQTFIELTQELCNHGINS